MTKLSIVTALALAACGTSAHDTTPDAPAAPGSDAGSGSGGPTPTTFQLAIDNVAPWTVLKSGAVTAKTGGAGGPAGPGDAWDITFTANKGQSISFASMWGESNDWFFAPGAAGIALYDGSGKPVSGDVTAQVTLWDAGTEENQVPGVGDATGPNQPNPNFGDPDPDPDVRELGTTITLTDGSSYTRPATTNMIAVTLTPGPNQTFTLHVANASTADAPIHLSPPVWALHIAPAPLFTVGQPDRGQGLEHLAEAGDGTALTAALHELSGWPTPISPGVWAVHRASDPLFALGEADRGQGLEHQAEDGNNAPLAAAIASEDGILSSGTFAIPNGGSAAGPAAPGAGYTITIAAVPGDRVSFVTMFGMSDDWFFGTRPEGIALFDATGAPTAGDVSDQIAIYDAGTEVDEEPAIGPDTGPQQPAPNTGAADPVDLVRAAAYSVPASTHLRVTLTPQPM